jgi:hypothetical protein
VKIACSFNRGDLKLTGFWLENAQTDAGFLFANADSYAGSREPLH